MTATINDAVEEEKEVPLHKKNPDVGTKKTVYAKNVIMEKEDADSFEDNEEVWCRQSTQHVKNSQCC